MPNDKMVRAVTQMSKIFHPGKPESQARFISLHLSLTTSETIQDAAQADFQADARAFDVAA
jgi:hypothetical protein